MNIVHTENSCGWGGQEIRILNEMAGMIARGHQLHLLCPPEARIYEVARQRGIPVTALPMAKKRPGGLLAIRRWLAEHPADVINSHSSTDSWLSALACASLPRAPVLVRTRHISAPVPDNAATRWLYTRATRSIVTTGEALKTQLVRDNGFPAANIVSVPTGIDLALYTPVAIDEARAALRARLGLPRNKMLIGIVATLRSWKGHRYLIEAFARLARADTHLLIVGDGPQRAALEQLIAGDGLKDQVTLAGNQSDVVPWLQALDLFALPSYANEGVPQAILQAFACGLPVVTTAAGAIPEVARHEDTALVVAMQDAAALGAALRRLLDDAALRSRLSANALAQARTHHGIDAMLDRMETVFRAALEAPA
ncbi:MAG: glycosyl transferase family 1 [Betaproteobacteria bacterium]|nr:glycosyl transferase family 1 [Betaproteobacteria bacterium]